MVRAPGQTSVTEEMLIWTGYLDGEVDRVAGGDFVKAVKAFQTALGASPATGELSTKQSNALQSEFKIAQRKWQFQKVSDPQGAELWLPRKLLPDDESLSFGRRYESDERDFSVDVAQFLMPSWTLKRLLGSPCCNATTLGKFEGPITTTSDAGMPAFMLNALDGRKRTSVRAFQKDNVIHLLSIRYDVARDKEFRILRNAIASKYVPFGSPVKEDRLMSCRYEDQDGAQCGEKPKGNTLPWLVQDRN